MKDSFQSFFDAHQIDVNMRRKSATWYQDQIKQLKGKTNPRKLISSEQDMLRSRIVPGNMYLFFYDPKTKDKLPYYDTFPLIFPYKKVGNNFWGLNFHYIQPALRVRMLDNLWKFKTNNAMDATTKMKLSWQLISSASTLKPLQPCVKQYRLDHVRSRFMLIEPKDWVTALLLPVERFVGATPNRVWNESITSIF